MKTLFLIFNHTLTSIQEEDARSALGIDTITSLPAALQDLWSNLPPELPAITEYLNPVEEWISSNAQAGDFVLIQGDFGACYLMVTFTLAHSLIPVFRLTCSPG